MVPGTPLDVALYWQFTRLAAPALRPVTEAIRQAGKPSIANGLRQQGVFALGHSRESVAEEQPGADKDGSEVVEAIHGAGIASRVVKMKPLGVIKG